MTRLGKNGPVVSKIGIGTLQWGDEACGFGSRYREPELAEAFAAAVAGGINFFDTAEVYGYQNIKYGQGSEQIVGRLAKEAREAGLPSPEALPVVGSKVFTVPWTNALMGGGMRMGRESLVAAAKASVERLGAPMQLWSIHFLFPGLGQGMLMDTLKEAHDLGLTQSVGVSNYNAAQLEEAHGLLDKAGLQLAANQVKYSLLDRAPEKNGVLKVAEERGIKVVAYSPLDGGQLAGKTPSAKEEVRQLVKLLEFLGAINGGRTPGQVALNYLVAKGAVPIPGCKSAAQAAEHAGALGWGLDENEVATISEKLDYLKK